MIPKLPWELCQERKFEYQITLRTSQVSAPNSNVPVSRPTNKWQNKYRKSCHWTLNITYSFLTVDTSLRRNLCRVNFTCTVEMIIISCKVLPETGHKGFHVHLSGILTCPFLRSSTVNLVKNSPSYWWTLFLFFLWHLVILLFVILGVFYLAFPYTCIFKCGPIEWNR